MKNSTLWRSWVKFLFVFFLSGFSFTDTENLQDNRRRVRTIFYSTLPLPPAHTFRYLFATLHMRWLLLIFNCNTCIYQTATQWDLPPYRITIWLINVMLIFVCLLVDLILGFATAIWHERNRWNQTRIDYHPCITSKLTNQVC